MKEQKEQFLRKNRYNELNHISSTNKASLQKELNGLIKLLIEMFNIQNEILDKTVWLYTGQIFGVDERTTILFTAIYKNLHVLHASLDLNIRGMYGSSRILMRYILEFLLIGKYCSACNDTNLIRNWEKGNDVSMKNNVFAKIKTPDLLEIKEFWGMLCKLNHATIYSQQIYFDWNKNVKEILLNFGNIAILLEMNYHLLNSHLFNKTSKYYFNFYSKNENIEYVNVLKGKMKENMKNSKNILLRPEGRKVIRQYISKWECK